MQGYSKQLLRPGQNLVCDPPGTVAFWALPFTILMPGPGTKEPVLYDFLNRLYCCVP